MVVGVGVDYRLSGVVVRVVVRVIVIVPVPVPGLPCCLLRVRPLDRFAVEQHAEAGAGEAAAARLARLDRDPGETEPGHRVLEHLERHAEVQAGAEEHVAGEAAASSRGGSRTAVRAGSSRRSSAGKATMCLPDLRRYQPPRALSDTQSPPRPTTMWSTRRTPTSSPARAMRRVNARSSAARRRIAARMGVEEDHPGGAAQEPLLEDLARLDRGAVERAAEDLALAQQAMPGVAGRARPSPPGRGGRSAERDSAPPPPAGTAARAPAARSAPAGGRSRPPPAGSPPWPARAPAGAASADWRRPARPDRRSPGAAGAPAASAETPRPAGAQQHRQQLGVRERAAPCSSSRSRGRSS